MQLLYSTALMGVVMRLSSRGDLSRSGGERTGDVAMVVSRTLAHGL